ncbi:hypothetical protein Tco_0580965 [Tanacetum coccineum]
MIQKTHEKSKHMLDREIGYLIWHGGTGLGLCIVGTLHMLLADTLSILATIMQSLNKVDCIAIDNTETLTIGKLLKDKGKVAAEFINMKEEHKAITYKFRVLILCHELLELRTQVAKEGSEVAKRAFVRLRKESFALSFLSQGVAELVHKTHLQCLLGRGCLIDSACDDSLIQAALLTLMPTNLLKLKEVTILTVAALASLVNWFSDIKIMEGLSRCAKPQQSYIFRGWEEAMNCRRSIIDDYRMARETNRLCREVVTMVEERSLFLEELDSLPGRRVPEKMAEFLLETQRKDTERLLQLQILGRETELRAREKEHFIQKLKGLMPF